MAIDPFPSLSKTPLPHPGTTKSAQSGTKTLSFYPDRGVYWEGNKGDDEYASAGDAGIKKTAPEGVLQGMLFRPETLKEHWNSPERVQAAASLDVEDSNVRRAIRESRMPTSLLHEVAKSGIKYGASVMDSQGYGGVYNPKEKTARTLPQSFIGDSYHRVVIHELGHGIHDVSARAKNNIDVDYGGNSVYVSNFADPLAEGHAEGISRRYTTGIPKKPSKDGTYELSYDNPKYYGWYGEGGHELYTHVRDSVSSTGKMHIINPKLLEPITKWHVFDNEGKRYPEPIGKEHEKEELATRFPTVLNMIKSGNTDVPKDEPTYHQPTLWDD